MIRLVVYHLLFLYLLCLQANAQINPVWKEYKEVNGLASNYVYSLKEDQRGLFWLATENGLVKFDGYHALEVPAIADSSGKPIPVYDICLMSDNKLWLGTKAGLIIYDPKHQQLIKHPITSKEAVRSVIYLGNNKILASSLHGVFLIQTDQNFNPISFKRFDFKQLDPEQKFTVSDLLPDTHDSLFIALFGHGIIKGSVRDLGEWDRFKRINNPFQSAKHLFSLPKEILKLPDDKLLINYLNEGLFVYNPKTAQVEKLYDLNVLDQPSFKYLTAIYFNNNYVYYSLRDLGLFRVSLGKKEARPESISFKSIPDFNFFDDRISSIYTRNSSLWITTIGGGIKGTSIKPKGLKSIPLQQNTQNHLNVYSVKADDTNNLLVSTFGEGVYFLKRNNAGSFAMERIDHHNNRLHLPSDSATEIHFTPKGDLWIGTYQGLCYYTKDQYQQFISGGSVKPKVYSSNPANSSSLSSNKINDIFEDVSGTLYVTTESGLNKIDVKSGLVYNHKNPPSAQAFKSDLQVYYGDFLADSSIILFSYWMNGIIRDGILNNHDYLFPDTYNVYVFHSVTDDQISWLGTNKGLYKYDGSVGRTVDFKERVFFKNKKINAITQDDVGTLWMGTNQGIFSYTPKNGTIEKHEIPGAESWPFFHYGSVSKAPNGIIYFGTSTGVLQIDPQLIAQDKTAPSDSCNIIISEIIINDRPIEPASFIKEENKASAYQTIKIGKDDVVEVLLGYSPHHLQEDIQFEYSLDEQKWFPVDPANPQILIYQLSKGLYDLSVRAMRRGSEVISAVKIPVEVEGPWWQSWWAYLLYFLFVAFIVVVYHRYRLHQLKLYQQLELEQVARRNQKVMDTLKTDFISSVSHEFRTPLTLILNDIDRIKSKGYLLDVKQLDKIEQNALRLKKLANELVDVKKLEHNDLKLLVSQHDIVSFVQDKVRLFEELAEKNQLKLSFTANKESQTLWFNPDQLEKVIINLISNALKFTLAKGKISIIIDCHLTQEPGERHATAITIHDTGVGIEEKDLDRVFKKDYSRPPVNANGFESAGIGLQLCKKIVELHHGQIMVKSKKDEGTTFTFILYNGSAHFSPDQLLKSSIHSVCTPPMPVASEISKDKNRQLSILIAEDNPEVRNYLSEILSDFYTVLEAKSGIDAIELTKAKLPDLIITDLAMPGKDGHALLKEVRENEMTSHIPIIVLTAFASDTKKAEVFSSGADMHLSKPSDKAVLLASVQNLLQSRAHLKKMFSDSVVDVFNLNQKSADSDFLKRAIAIITKQMSDPYFDVTALAARLKVSRSLLYQKFPDLTNYSPKEFIHIMRVRKGAKLLKSGRYNINEASDETGYNNPKNFRKYFKSYFGISPSEYLKNSKVSH